MTEGTAASSSALGTVLVTGASGFVGRHLVGHLAGCGYRVRAASRPAVHHRRLENRPRPPDDLARRIERVDLPDLARLTDPIAWSPLLEGVDTVVHLAGIAHQSRRLAEATYMQVNGHATEALALAVRSSGVRRLIFVSSVRAQSGPVNDRVLTESQPATPSDAYGRSKLRGEIGVAGALTHAEADYVILRPVLVYGRGVGGNMRLLARLARSRLPLPVGALDGQRSLVAVEALADAIAHVIGAPAAARTTLLVADPGPALTAKRMVMALRAGLGRTALIVPVSPRLLRGGARLAGRRDAVERLAGPLVVDTSALAATGWRPTIGTAAGLYLWMQSEARAGLIGR